MLTLTEIEKFYPDFLRVFKRFILREYLQCKILQIIFESEYAPHLTFLGGTCLRIAHGNKRFSEDLDFDNFRIKEDAFENVAQLIKKELSREGYNRNENNLSGSLSLLYKVLRHFIQRRFIRPLTRKDSNSVGHRAATF